MNILFIWVWAFWFAMLKHISTENNFLHHNIYWYEKDVISFESLILKRESPYFFHWVKLDDRIKILSNIDEIISQIDLIVISIPNQTVDNFIDMIKDSIKSWVIFLNLSKWINNKTLKTVNDILKDKLILPYNYRVLSGGMIASEVVSGNFLWAIIAWEDLNYLQKLKEIFWVWNLDIKLSLNYKNTEIIWSLKNIIAIYIWYLEYSWIKKSSISYYAVNLFEETKKLIVMLWWTLEENINTYDFLWDMIATCFWESRNRYLWSLLASWKSIDDSLEIMKNEKKHSEWYETFLWIKDIILQSDLVFYKKISLIFWN